MQHERCYKQTSSKHALNSLWLSGICQGFWLVQQSPSAAGMLFGWETIMTFVLVSVVYAVAIGEPSFGVMGPFAMGHDIIITAFLRILYEILFSQSAVSFLYFLSKSDITLL